VLSKLAPTEHGGIEKRMQNKNKRNVVQGLMLSNSRMINRHPNTFTKQLQF